VPGEFVSPELRDACARFLDELMTSIGSRGDEAAEREEWIPPERNV
jgi:hypothetical protein